VGTTLPRGGALILVAVGLAQVLVTLDYFSLTVALPQMARDLDVTTTNLQWALTAYLLSFAALLVAGGRIGDILGRRRALLVGVALFGLASLACGLATDEITIVVARVVQGVGAAVLFPTSMAIVSQSFDEKTRPRAIGIVVAVSTLGTALGPLVGGVLTETLDWRWVFFINVPFSAIAGLMIVRYVPESRDESAPRHIDVPGIATLATGIVALTLAIDRGPAWIEDDPLALLGCLLVCVVALVSFVVIELRAANPLIDLPTFRSPAFVMVTLSGFLSNFLWALAVFVATLWLQEVEDLSPLESGLAFLAMSVGVAAAGPLSGRLVTRFDVGLLMALASLVGAASAFAISFIDALPVWLPVFLVLGLGVGTNYALVNQGTLAAVPRRQAGAASGIALTAIVIAAALATVIGATLLEEISGSSMIDQDAVAAVMRVGAAVALASAVPAALLWRRRARAAVV
jgi:EmrB/QacA subfamily drug resistance transporter